MPRGGPRPLLSSSRRERGCTRLGGLALRQIAPPTQPVIEALIGALGDLNVKVRTEAATALGHIGRRAKNALPALMKCFQQAKKRELRNSIAYALGRLGAAAAPAVLMLGSGLLDSDEEFASLAASAFQDRFARRGRLPDAAQGAGRRPPRRGV